MELASASVVRGQLIGRRDKLQAALSVAGPRAELRELLSEVDAALRRLDVGTYGLCEVCQDPIEPDRILADPLARFCLDHLSPDEQRGLEQDLELAARIQRGLLPDPHARIDGWDLAYEYRPARIVGGDYCDVIPSAAGGFHFLLGDVSGKGVAASMLMAHLHAMFRTLVSLELPLRDLMERASRAFCESTLPTHYATLVCGKASASGEIEVCNAGHLPIVITSDRGLRMIASSALPVGMFCSERFETHRLELTTGDTMLLVSDGVTESENATGQEYGLERLATVAQQQRGLSPAALIAGCLRDLFAHTGRSRQDDDMTLFAVRRRPETS